MKRVAVLALAMTLSAPSLAQQLSDSTPITLTWGEINKIVNARVADALAQDAMNHLNMQVMPKPPPAASEPAHPGSLPPLPPK